MNNPYDRAVSIAMSDGYLDELQDMAEDGDEDSQVVLEAIRGQKR